MRYVLPIVLILVIIGISSSLFWQYNTKEDSNPEYIMNWGIEDWNYTTDQFKVQVGNGSDIAIDSIQGVVSGAMMPGGTPDSSVLRNALISIAYRGQNNTVGVVLKDPIGSSFNDGIGANLLSMNLKQMGTQPVNLNFNYNYPQVLIQNGVLKTYISNTSYITSGVSSNPRDSLDTEIHLEISYHYNK